MLWLEKIPMYTHDHDRNRVENYTPCLTTLSIFEQIFNFSPICRLFVDHFDFWPKLWFSTKISMLDQNYDFWLQFPFLTTFRFLNKITILIKQNHCFAKIIIFNKSSIEKINFDHFKVFPTGDRGQYAKMPMSAL